MTAVDPLWAEYGRTRSDAVKDGLFAHYYAWALSVASTVPLYVRGGVLDRSDIENITAETLLLLLDRYDPQRQVSFEVYSRKRLRGAVLNAVNSELKHVKKRAWHAEDLNPVDNLLMEVTNAVDELILEALLEEFVGQDKESPESLVFRDSELRGLVHDAITVLTERESEVIRYHYYADKTNSEIAESLGLSKGRISQLLASAHYKIRQNLLDRGNLDAFW